MVRPPEGKRNPVKPPREERVVARSLVIPTQAELASAFPPNNALREVADLAQRQIELEDRIAKGRAYLADLEDRLKDVQSIDIPAAMSAAGLSMFALENGAVVKVEDFTAASISEANRAAAFAWLRDNKFGSLIKNVMSLQFGMGQDLLAREIAKACAAALKKHKLDVPIEQKESVHPSTLRAFVKERLAEGKALPPEITVVQVPTTKITRSK